MRQPRTENAPPAASTKSEGLHPVLEIVQSGEAGATVTVPPDGSLDSEARRIVQAVRTRYNVELAVVSGDRALRELPTQHAIALGCLADNPFVQALYYHWNTLVDRWYPGSGGWVVQMIPSPHRQGDCVLLLGGSDPQGVGVATGRFIEELKTNDTGRMPWKLEVQLGAGHLPLPEDRMDCLGTASSPMLTPESALPESLYESGFGGGSARDHLLRLGMYGPHADNFHLCRSSQLGLRFLYTGRLGDAERYRGTLLEEVRSGAAQRLYHYKSVRMFQLWGLLGGCPVFDDDEREEITRAIRIYLLEESGVASMEAIREASVGSGIFNRHLACDALNLWVGADWLRRRTGESRWLDDRSAADVYFAAQAGTDVPLTGLTEGYASYLEVYLEWMLLSCPDRIPDDPHIRLWAQRVMGLCTNSGQLVLGPQTDESRYPYHLMRKLAYLLDDGCYLFVADLRERQVRQGMDRVLQFSAGQAYAGDVEAREPRDEVGLITFPMNERLRRWKAPSIAPGKGFDRAVARSGWNAEDDYLMIVGVRSGAKSLPNVGTLAAYERFGRRLITSDSVPLYPSSASPWRHSLVTVSAGGLGAGMAEGAEILAMGEAGFGGHLLAFRVDTPGLCRWHRLLYWKPSAYVLVVDRLLVEVEETFTLGVNWRCAGQMSVEGNLATLNFSSEGGERQFYVQVCESLRLEAETNAYPALGAPPGSPPSAEVMLHATVDRCGRDGEVEVATLLHAVAGTAGPRYRLGGGDEGWIVESQEEALVFGRGAEEGEMAIEVCPPVSGTVGRGAGVAFDPMPRGGPAGCGLTTRWSFDLPAQVSAWSQAADGPTVALGTGGGDVVVLDAEGKGIWTTQCEAAVTALTFFEGDLIVGTRSGQVSRFDEDGVEQWRHRCRFRVERPFWPWWFMDTPVIGALAVGRDPASGRDLVAVGTGSTSLNFLEAGGGGLIGDVVSPYGLPDRIRAHVSADGGLQFLVGHSWLTCGSTVRAWSPSPQTRQGVSFHHSANAMGRTTDGWDTCGVVDFRVGPLVCGLPDQVVVLRHGAVNQITVYDEATGDPLWDAGLGGVPVALAVLPGEESAASARCYVAEQFGWLVGFDGTGRRVAATHVAPSLRQMHAADTAGGLLALWNLEELYIARGDRVTVRYRLDGYPLGWHAHRQYPGLLCVQQRKLVMKDVRDWEG